MQRLVSVQEETEFVPKVENKMKIRRLKLLILLTLQCYCEVPSLLTFQIWTASVPPAGKSYLNSIIMLKIFR